MSNLNNRKVLSMIAHGSALFSWSVVWMGVPIVLLLVCKDEVVKANACEALNYGLIGTIVWAIFGAGVLCTFGLGVFLLFPLLPLIVVISILPIIGMCKVAWDADYVYRYPLMPRIITYPSLPPNRP